MTVAAIDRCLNLVEALAGEADGLDLGVIAERLHVPKSAAHRLLATLAAHGFVIQNPETRAYSLSLRFALLAFRNLDARGLTDATQIVLDNLAHETGEYCRLAVVEGEKLIWVARAQGAPAGLRYDPNMGQELILHATANGKAWLATLPEDEALRIVCARGFDAPHPLGPKCIKTVGELRRHLAETRRRGYAVAIEEGESGIVAVAVTFRSDAGADSPVAGTISVAGPLVRMSAARRTVIAERLHAASAAVSALWPLRRRQARRSISGEPNAGPPPMSSLKIA